MAIVSTFPEKRGLNTDDINDIANGEISNGFVQSQFNFSAEEQVIGKWVDGKPLYQKTIIITGCSSNGWNTTNHNIANIENIIYETGVVKCTNGTFYGLGFRTTEVCGMVQATVTTVGMYLGTHSVYNNATCFVTIQYTKTTD